MWIEELSSSVMSPDCARMEAEFRTARIRVSELLAEGRSSEVFLAFCHAVSGTEIRVGSTEGEDPSSISPQRVQDYIEGFLEAEEDLCARDFCTNEDALLAGSLETLRRRHTLYAGIVAAPSITSLSGTLGT